MERGVGVEGRVADLKVRVDIGKDGGVPSLHEEKKAREVEKA